MWDAFHFHEKAAVVILRNCHMMSKMHASVRGVHVNSSPSLTGQSGARSIQKQIQGPENTGLLLRNLI